MGEVRELAQQLDADEGTLRRGVRCGLIKARRLGPRRLVISPGERTYLGRHWALLSRLRRALRTERNVRMGVVFGSVARGTGGRGSDVDILVSFGDARFGRKADLARRLKPAVDREVQVLELEDAERDPSLLADILEDGRVLVDRDGQWPRLKTREPRVRGAASRADADLSRRAREAVEYLRANP